LEVGSQKTEVRRRKTENGRLKLEVGSRKMEDGRWKMEDGRLTENEDQIVLIFLKKNLVYLICFNLNHISYSVYFSNQKNTRFFILAIFLFDYYILIPFSTESIHTSDIFKNFPFLHLRIIGK
jgi:hypothetical protein